MRRRGDFNTTKFWRWFEGEADGIANGIEALTRGEADAEWLLIELNERVQRYDPDLVADVRKTLDHTLELSIRSVDIHSAVVLVLAAPRVPGWCFSAPGQAADLHRMPFRLAPPPSLDKGARITGRHEAYVPEIPVH